MTQVLYVVHFKADNESFLFENAEDIGASLSISYRNCSVKTAIEWDTLIFGQIYEIRPSGKIEIGTIKALPVLQEATHF